MSIDTQATAFDTLCVADLMSRDIVTTTPDTTVADLVKLLAFEQISGVPVLSRRGRLVGVVSATDIVRLASTADEVSLDALIDEDDDAWQAAYADAAPYFADTGARRRLLVAGLLSAPRGTLGDYTVRDIMTPASFTVRPTATVAELAAFMTNGRIHRALVVDDGQLLGIVSGFDVVRAVAGAIEPGHITGTIEQERP
jgi:CBS domain-containing protein